MKILEVAIIIVRRIESDLLFVKSCCGWCLPADCLRVVERKGGAEKKKKVGSYRGCISASPWSVRAGCSTVATLHNYFSKTGRDYCPVIV